MDIHLDTSWCPVCDKHILPKRYSVPLNPPPPLPRGKNGTIKARPNNHGGGLLHGTGRLRPAAALRRDSASPQNHPLPLPAAPATPVKTRTVIDQAQTPLYCSDACRQQDLHSVLLPPPDHPPSQPHPALLNPASRSPPPPSPTLPPVPPNSWSARLSDPEQSDSSSSTTSASYPHSSPLDDLPHPPHLWDLPAPPSDNSGIIMAARRLQAFFCPPPEPLAPPTHEKSQPVVCTDAPHTEHTPTRRPSPARYAKYPLRSCVARPGARPLLAAPPTTSTSYDTSYSHTHHPRSLERAPAPVPAPAAAPPAPRRRRRDAPRGLLLPGAEGRLLVPDVKLKPFGARPASTSSLADLARPARTRRSLSRHDSDASLACSQLGSVREERGEGKKKAKEGQPSSLPEKRRLAMESRTWSYDSLCTPTYPIMPALPTKRVRHARVFVPDGAVLAAPPARAEEAARRDTEVSRRRGEEGGRAGWWVVLEIEAMVVPERKRLFLFAGK